MTVRRRFFALLASSALLLGAGCGAGDRTPVAAETDEPAFRQGQQLKNQGRNGEALVAFLHVIEKRGEQAAAQSHLEAGVIYLNSVKDPLEAIHQFRKYLELQPNSQQARYVQGQIESAKREFARTLHPDPFGSQSAQFDLQQKIDDLQRENAELKAELAPGSAPGSSSLLRMRAPADADVSGSRAEPPPVIGAAASSVSLAPLPPPGVPGGSPAVMQPTVRSAPPAKSSAVNATATHRYIVQPSDGLYSIAKKYYGTGSMAKAHAIYEANRDVMKSESDLRPGMELKMP